MGAKRDYYRIVFELKSALSIGAADSVGTDKDVVLDSRGRPMIPATSLAGAYRSFFTKDEAQLFFGKRLTLSLGEPDLVESLVRIYDATWIEGSNEIIAVRDNVSLQNKVAREGLKFDREVVERGARFLTFIEVLDADICRQSKVKELLGAIQSGSIAFGSKTTRGFGRVSIVDLRILSYDLSDDASRDKWLEFRMFEEACWQEGASVKADNLVFEDATKLRISLDLVQRGALSVREYSTEPDKPDFGQLYIRGQRDNRGYDVPVVPGTSWAGAFRERYTRFGSEEQAEKLFGFVKPLREGGSDVCKSRIIFSESIVENGEWKEITRNAIDRFTGGTKDGALFTLRAYYAGNTRLNIDIALTDEELTIEDFVPLVQVISDLHNGLMSIGGLSAVGNGLFSIVGASVSVGGNRYERFLQDLTIGSTEGVPASPDAWLIAKNMVELVDGLNSKEEVHV